MGLPPLPPRPRLLSSRQAQAAPPLFRLEGLSLLSVVRGRHVPGLPKGVHTARALLATTWLPKPPKEPPKRTPPSPPKDPRQDTGSQVLSLGLTKSKRFLYYPSSMYHMS